MQAQSTQQAKNATLTVTGAVSWRRPGLKYSKNEVFLDIVEEVNLLMSSTGAQPGCQCLCELRTCSKSPFVLHRRLHLCTEMFGSLAGPCHAFLPPFGALTLHE